MATSFRDDARPGGRFAFPNLHCNCAINEVGAFNHMLDLVALQAVLLHQGDVERAERMEADVWDRATSGLGMGEGHSRWLCEQAQCEWPSLLDLIFLPYWARMFVLMQCMDLSNISHEPGCPLGRTLFSPN